MAGVSVLPTEELLSKRVQEMVLNGEEPPQQYICRDGDDTEDDSTPTSPIPIIDMSLLSCSWGCCFQAIGHGISSSFLDKIRQVAREFFGQPMEEKKKKIPEEGQPLDWSDRLFLDVYPEDRRKLKFWPENPNSFSRSGKGESSFRPLLQESNTNYQQESGMQSSQEQWRSQKIFSGRCEDSSIEFKQINRPGFSLDQPQLSSHISSGDSTSVTCQGLSTPTFLMDSGHVYIRASPPKQPPHSHLHFSNNATFWNASAAAMNSSFFPSLQIPTPSFDEKPKNNTSEVGPKKSSNEASTKRPRNDTTTPLPAFKVRKEKMGDRITALHQLVSPFGKTDTVSVLSEAIEYIKFLHDQINVLTTPYMKSVAPIQHQQKSKEDPEGAKQHLRGRGLCLVPVSSTFPVTHETTIDFWTPTFGGTFR